MCVAEIGAKGHGEGNEELGRSLNCLWGFDVFLFQSAGGRNLQ